MYYGSFDFFFFFLTSYTNFFSDHFNVHEFSPTKFTGLLLETNNISSIHLQNIDIGFKWIISRLGVGWRKFGKQFRSNPAL